MGSLGSFDEEVRLSAQSPHRSLFRAFSVARYSGNTQRIDGFPYLIFSIGQVPFSGYVESNDRNLTLCLKRMIDGWRGFLGLTRLDGYPRVIVFRYLCEWLL